MIYTPARAPAPTAGQVEARVWSNAPFNFDNLYQSVLSLFVVSSMDGYRRDARTLPYC